MRIGRLGVSFGLLQNVRRPGGRPRIGPRSPAPRSTTPSVSAAMRCSIFMASRITSGSPADTTVARLDQDRGRPCREPGWPGPASAPREVRVGEARQQAHRHAAAGHDHQRHAVECTDVWSARDPVELDAGSWRAPGGRRGEGVEHLGRCTGSPSTLHSHSADRASDRTSAVMRCRRSPPRPGGSAAAAGTLRQPGRIGPAPGRAAAIAASDRARGGVSMRQRRGPARRRIGCSEVVGGGGAGDDSPASPQDRGQRLPVRGHAEDRQRPAGSRPAPAAAWSRSAPVPMTLAIIGSYSGEISLPVAPRCRPGCPRRRAARTAPAVPVLGR